jgi:hypothetical protein
VAQSKAGGKDRENNLEIYKRGVLDQGFFINS